MRVTRRLVAWFVLGCAGMALMVAVLYIVLQAAHTTAAIRSSQKTNTQINLTNQHLLQEVKGLSLRVRSCTTPGEKCYSAGQRRTGDAVASINQVVILAAACAVGQTGTVVEIQTAIQACVIERLAADQHSAGN